MHRRPATRAVACAALPSRFSGACSSWPVPAISVGLEAHRPVLARELAPLLAVATVVGLPLTWIENFTERSTGAFQALPMVLVALVAMTALAAAPRGHRDEHSADGGAEGLSVTRSAAVRS